MTLAPTDRPWTNSSILAFAAGRDPLDAASDAAQALLDAAHPGGCPGPPVNVVELAKLLGLNLAPGNTVVDAAISPDPALRHPQAQALAEAEALGGSSLPTCRSRSLTTRAGHAVAYGSQSRTRSRTLTEAFSALRGPATCAATGYTRRLFSWAAAASTCPRSPGWSSGRLSIGRAGKLSPACVNRVTASPPVIAE